MEILDAVLTTLQKNGTPMKSGEIADQTGIEKKEVDKALKILKDTGSIEIPKRCYYAAK